MGKEKTTRTYSGKSSKKRPANALKGLVSKFVKKAPIPQKKPLKKPKSTSKKPKAPKRAPKIVKKAVRKPIKAVKRVPKPVKKAIKKPKSAPKKAKKPVKKTVKKAKIAPKTPKPVSRKPKIAPKPRPKLTKKEKIEQLRLKQYQRKYLQGLIGSEGLHIVRQIGMSEIAENELVEDLRMKPTRVRRHLYKLYDRGIAKLRQERAPNGWRTYYWRIDTGRLDHFAK
jgi:DNA-binding transcriptional ArsR family regulator